MRIADELILLVFAGAFLLNALLIGLPLRRLAHRIYPDSLLTALAFLPGLSFIALWWLAFAGGAGEPGLQRRSFTHVPAGDIT